MDDEHIDDTHHTHVTSHHIVRCCLTRTRSLLAPPFPFPLSLSPVLFPCPPLAAAAAVHMTLSMTRLIGWYCLLLFFFFVHVSSSLTAATSSSSCSLSPVLPPNSTLLISRGWTDESFNLFPLTILFTHMPIQAADRISSVEVFVEREGTFLVQLYSASPLHAESSTGGPKLKRSVPFLASSAGFQSLTLNWDVSAGDLIGLSISSASDAILSFDQVDVNAAWSGINENIVTGWKQYNQLVNTQLNSNPTWTKQRIYSFQANLLSACSEQSYTLGPYIHNNSLQHK